MAKAAATMGRASSSTIFKEAKTFSSFSVTDLQQAKEFYGQKLGLRVSEQPEGLAINLPDGNSVFLYAKPNHTPASFTVLNFIIDDIEDAVDELGRLGVRMEKYNQPNLQTDERGIHRGGRGPTIAWFKDPAGNIISVMEE